MNAAVGTHFVLTKKSRREELTKEIYFWEWYSNCSM